MGINKKCIESVFKRKLAKLPMPREQEIVGARGTWCDWVDKTRARSSSQFQAVMQSYVFQLDLKPRKGDGSVLDDV